MSQLVKNHNSQILSRVGFVSEEMKEYEFIISNEIRDRGNEINNATAQCILDAQQALELAVYDGGEAVKNAAVQWYEEVHLLSDELVYPILNELENIMSQFEKEFFVILSSANGVTDIERILETVIYETTVYADLFEGFALSIFLEMTIFDMYMNNINRSIFPELSSARDYFRFNGLLIRNTLETCVE